MTEYCVCCGEEIPEGRVVCTNCERKVGIEVADSAPECPCYTCEGMEYCHKGKCGILKTWISEKLIFS